MSVLKNLVADVVEEIRGVFSGNRKSALSPRACVAETDEYRTFASVTAHGDAVGDATLALRSSNEEPRPGDCGLLPGTALPGPGTYPARPGPPLEADVFIETDAVQGILGDVDWDVLAGGDAAVRILGDDGQLIERGRG
ncbi:MAG TPA: hypothetical protein DC046_02620 [Rhodospirillaceae bacterium]|nr:hypothetical protein [Rhodospirillaceae bacterium]